MAVEKKTQIALDNGWFVRSERIEGKRVSEYGDAAKTPVGHEVWKCEHRFYIVRVERTAGKKGEASTEKRSLILATPEQLNGAVEIDAAGMRSRDAADIAARVLQLTV